MTDRVPPASVPLARRVRHLVAPALVAAAAGLALACSDVKTGPNTPVALSFDSLPFPAIVVGDSLRDSTGAVVPLRATAYNGDGDAIADAPIRWFVLTRDTAGRATHDTVLLVVDSLTGIAWSPAPSDAAVLARRRTQNVTVVPQVNGLAGPTRAIPLTLSPDSLLGPDTARVAGALSCLDTTYTNRSALVSARLRHDSAGTARLPVRSWPVRFTLLHAGAVVPDSSRALRLLNDVGRASAVDTTDESGNVSRRVWFRADSIPGFAALKTGSDTGHVSDSARVVVSTRYRGAPVPALHDTIVVQVTISRTGAACK